MTRKFLLVFAASLTLIISLHNCKTEKPDPDGDYVGTPYTITQPEFGFPPIHVPSEITMTKEGVQLGRMLFYDPILSSDSMFSCSSCHKQQFAFSDGGKVLSENIFGPTKRNTP